MRNRLAGLAMWLAWAGGAFAQPLAAPPVAAKAYVLVDMLSGQTLAAANEADRFEPASLTKLMTAYVVFGALRDGNLIVKGNRAGINSSNRQTAYVFTVVKVGDQQLQ